MFFIRRHLKFLIAILIITLLIPGLLNRYNDINDCEIRFTSPSGFYEDTLSLGIEGGAGFDIYYTLDGSVPTRDSIRYQPGSVITVSDASENENVLSKRTDISTGYSEYVPSPTDFAVPEENVDKCTIVRAAAFPKVGSALHSIQGVYFVGFQNKPAYQNVFVVSIHAKPEDLFDYHTGILVTGSKFDEYVQSSMNENGEFAPTDVHAAHYWWWPSNYSKGGKQWEREVRITVFDTQREIQLDQQCGIRIHGGGSRGYPSKSIRCVARKEYAGEDTFPVDWFGEDIEPRKFVLYSGGDDNMFKLRDYLGQTLAQPLNIATQEFIPCCLFINGEYWGFYYLSENYNKNYISEHYDVTDDNVILVKSGALEEGTNRDIHLFNNMRRFIIRNDMSVEENYREACELIDIDSYIDYFAFQIYTGRNTDWPRGNYGLWRVRNQEASPFGDGKWRWMLYDLNSGDGMTLEALQEDTLAFVFSRDSMFKSLWKSPEFRSRFSARILEIGSTFLSADACAEFINDYDALFRDQLALNSKRFFNSEKEAEYTAYIDEMRTFFSERYPVVQQFLADHMDP